MRKHELAPDWRFWARTEVDLPVGLRGAAGSVTGWLCGLPLRCPARRSSRRHLTPRRSWRVVFVGAWLWLRGHRHCSLRGCARTRRTGASASVSATQPQWELTSGRASRAGSNASQLCMISKRRMGETSVGRAKRKKMRRRRVLEPTRKQQRLRVTATNPAAVTSLLQHLMRGMMCSSAP